MKKVVALLLVVAGGYWAYTWFVDPAAPDLTHDGNAVILAAGELDARFARGAPFEGTYMLFGGVHSAHENALSNVTLVGVEMKHARPIHESFPDLHRCSSEGAAKATDAIEQLDLVPGNGRTLRVLRSAVDRFGRNVGEDADRVCVALEGSRLALGSAELREQGHDVTERYGSQEFYLVTTAKRIDCKRALAGA